MNKRQERLIALLSERQDWMNGRQLATILQVSDRTIRSDVESINRAYEKMLIESSVRFGYRLVEETSISAGKILKSEIPQTPGARCVYIIQKLLFEVKEINLTVLQSQIFVSGYSIENDLKRIRKMIAPYSGLRLVRNKECISLKGDEISKRKFYKDLLVAEVQENFLNMNQLASLYKNFDLIEIKDIFEGVLDEYDYAIKESLFPMLILHAGTSIERMLHSNYISRTDDSRKLDETIEYQISQTFFKRVAARLHIAVHQGEVEMLALVIMGRKASSFASDHVKIGDQWFHTKKLVTEGLERIYNVFGLDFRRDEDLIAGLKMHLHGLIERARNEIRLENLFLDEVKQKYPLVFEMGICMAEYLEEKIGAGIVETESGYIALHLGGASERMNARRKYKAVLVLPYNQTFSDMCVKKLTDMFGERMELAKVVHIFEDRLMKELEPDLILAAAPITHTLDIPTIPVNLFVDSGTETAVLQALNKLDKKGFQLEFTTHIGSLIRKEFYYEGLKLSDPMEIIEYLCSELEKGGAVDGHFREVVLKREEMSPTSFVNAFAIPHAFGPFAKKSTIAVAHLSRPVKWGNFEVRLVMLFAINQGDHRVIKMFFDWISAIVNEPEKLADLCRGSSYEEFIERITD